jgi:hypothetical protein
VKARPRQAVLTRNQIFIKRLVLMPKKDDAQRGHVWSSQSSTHVADAMARVLERINATPSFFTVSISGKFHRICTVTPMHLSVDLLYTKTRPSSGHL